MRVVHCFETSGASHAVTQHHISEGYVYPGMVLMEAESAATGTVYCCIVSEEEPCISYFEITNL
jgi:hypothetical protein